MKRILVVDDDPDILDALQLNLEADGYSVKTTSKNIGIYEEVMKYHPDIILLDVVLSGKDGRLICKHLKLEAATKGIPVIMISAHPSVRPSTLQVGADEFIAKPFDMRSLTKTIEKYA